MSQFALLEIFRRRLVLGLAFFVLVLGLAFFVSYRCSSKGCFGGADVSPEEQLRSYIDLAVNITRMEQREELENFTTGDFRDQFAAAAPEAFKKSYLDRRYEFDEFEVTGRSEIVKDKELDLEYRVKFRTWLVGEDRVQAPVQEIKSIAKMKYTKGHWAIASIRPLDTSYNWDVGMPMAGVSGKGDSPEGDPAESEATQTDSLPSEDSGMSQQPSSEQSLGAPSGPSP